MNSSSSGETSDEANAFERLFFMLKEAFGRSVDQQNALLRIQGNDAGGDARQDGFGESATCIKLRVGGHQSASLLLQAS